MTARAATATATTIQIVPFWSRSISTTATANPAAMRTLAARTVPVRDRRALTAALPEHARDRRHHSRGVGVVRRRRRDHQRLDVMGPRPPDELIGPEEDDRPGADRRGQMADARVVPDVEGGVSQHPGEQWKRRLSEP